MTPSRMAEAERSLTTTAKKVFDIVPISEAWTLSQFYSEITRSGLRIEQNILQGCLKALKDCGLVLELSHGQFTRRQARPQPIKTIESIATDHVGTPTPKMDTMTKLADMAATLREQAAELITLANGIDDVAVEFEERIAAISEDTQKLKQLRSLLGSIGS